MLLIQKKTALAKLPQGMLLAEQAVPAYGWLMDYRYDGKENIVSLLVLHINVSDPSGPPKKSPKILVWPLPHDGASWKCDI